MALLGEEVKTIYVTGAPAAGKSSTLKLLSEADPSVIHFEYGSELTKYIQERDASLKNHDELREKSSGVVTPEDIAALDEILLRKVGDFRKAHSILIDSHPVTKESFGFRVTAFSQEKVVQLNPDEIWVFYASPEVTLQRIEEAHVGRPSITKEESRMHTSLQASVAATYGIMAGVPVYNFDTNRSQNELVGELLARLKK